MDLIKVGDLVSKSMMFHPPKNIYGNITHEQYEVITGNGDKNSKLKVTVSYFVELEEKYSWEAPENIKYFETPLVKVETNMRNLVLHNEKKLKITIQSLQEKITKINNKIDFLRKHRNIIEKIN